jgi:aminopeptidase N
MALYAPESHLAALSAASNFFFEFTKLSLEFYEETFGITYPYQKYDHAFVPNFYDEAM